jgi:hypothetical protein
LLRARLSQQIALRYYLSISFRFVGNRRLRDHCQG